MVGIVDLLVFAVGTPGNCLVLYLTFDIFRRHRGRVRNENHEFEHGKWLVLMMASFDLLFCLIHAPMMFAMLLLVQFLQMTHFSCTVMYFAAHVSTTGSSLSLLVLNVEEFIKLHKPLHYRSLITKRRTVTASVIIWLVSTWWAIFALFGPFMSHAISAKGQCYQKVENAGIYALFALQFFLLPSLISLSISIFTLFAALRIRRHRQKPGLQEIELFKSEKGKLGRTMTSERNCSDYGKENSRSDVKLSNGGNGENSCLSLMSVVGFVFTTTVWTSVTSLPYRIGYLWAVVSKSNSAKVILFSLFTVLILNAAGNPFITIITKRQYSDRIRELVNWKKNNQRRQHTISTRHSEEGSSPVS